MPRTSQRTSVFTESLIREMSRVAARYGAIKQAQGFPDREPPAALIQAAKDAMDTHRHQYAVTWGSAELRAALGAKLTRFMGIPVDVDRELVVTCGATEAMMVAMMTVCDPGDQVGMFSPFYENYSARVDSHRRSLRAHCLPAAPTHVFRDTAGYGAAHVDVFVAFEDIFDYRLEAGLRARRTRGDCTGAEGA
jgi:aminotransferase